MPHSGPSLAAPVHLPTLLQRGLQARPDEPAIVSMDEAWTWSKLERATSRLAANYLALGLKPGDRVASLMPHRIALIANYLACFKAGLVLTPLNYRYTPPEIDHAVAVSGARIILAHAERASDIAASKAASLPLGVIGYGAEKGTGRSFADLAKAEPTSVVLPEPDAKAPAAIFFTSGSTGPAKGVTHSVASLGWMLGSAAAAFELTADDIVLPGSSCSHISGFGFSLSTLSVGGRTVVARTLDHTELGSLLLKIRPTVFSMLPTGLLHLIREHDMTAEDFSSLRLCRSGGDKVPAELEKEFKALTGHLVSEGYGLTETGLAARNPPSGLDKLGSIGLPSPGFTFSLRDGQGREVADGKEGRVWLKTATEMLGYWNDPQATAEVNRDGWFDTGDVMKADQDGYLWFCGRQKQIIVHDGSNISPQEVEDALLDHPAVESAGVVGVHNLMHGENVRAYVALKPGAVRPKAAELIRFARAHVGYKAPEEIVFLDAMPLNPTGKVDRAALKALAAGEHAQVQ
ncbi:MAG TPA: class I adenylate-forming enzyme family protein [Methyloceanibacter sp.]|nr:class I adenylate-forming enzyme family protein [Methyloceanibacter sp.]